MQFKTFSLQLLGVLFVGHLVSAAATPAAKTTTLTTTTTKTISTKTTTTTKSSTTTAKSSTTTTTTGIRKTTTTTTLTTTTTTKSTSTTTSTTSNTITSSPTLSCTSGSTVKLTSDCTYPQFSSYICYSPPPPISCDPSSYPSVYHPGHCATFSTCFPVDAPYITKSCPPGHGFTTFSVSTLYSGTLAGESTATVITDVECYCPSTEYYSYTTIAPATTASTYCLPHTNCPRPMLTSTSTNEYCATEPPESCSDVPLTTKFCSCPSGSTPVYYEASTVATPTGCRKVS